MRHLTIKTTILVTVAVLLMPTVSEAQYRPYQPGDSGSVRILLGQFDPDCDSQYWDEKFTDFTGSAKDFEDYIFQVDYRFPLSHGTALLFGLGWYEGATTQAYRDYVDAGGNDISHKTALSTGDLSMAWIFEFGQRRNAVTPYIGLGAGYLWWELEEAGDFIDFGDPDLPIFNARYRSTGSTWELFAVVGVDFRISHSASLVVQARWHDADDELGDDFAGFGTIDLSGLDYSLGVSFNF